MSDQKPDSTGLWLRIWFPIVLAALGPVTASWIYVHGVTNAGSTQTVYFLSKLFLNAFPLVWWITLERPVGQSVLRWPRKPARTDILWGLTSGLLIGLAIWIAYQTYYRDHLPVEQLRGQVQQFGAYHHFVLFSVFLSIVNSGLEEYYWRWFVFGRMRQQIPVRWAGLLSALAFAAHHYVVLQDFFQSEALAAIFSLGVAIGGAVWAAIYQHTGRLWGVWLSHALTDAAVFSVGYHILFILPA